MCGRIVVAAILDYSWAMIRLLLILTLGSASLVAAESRYRIVHPDGSVEFTDQPVEGAEPVTLPEITTYSSTPSTSTPPSSGTPANGTEATTANQSEGYTLFTISSPEDQQTVWFDAKGMNVSVQVEPELAEGDVVTIRIDGEVVATGNATTYLIQDVYRGTHTLSAVITNAQGVVIEEAGPVSFTMRQHSILHPKPEELN